MTAAQSDRATRLAERFNQPEPEQTPAPVEVVAPVEATKKSVSRPSKAAKPTLERPAEVPHTKRTFYVRADLVEQVETETRRLNYELGGVKLVEVLNAVLEAGLAQMPAIEARITSGRK